MAAVFGFRSGRGSETEALIDLDQAFIMRTKKFQNIWRYLTRVDAFPFRGGFRAPELRGKR